MAQAMKLPQKEDLFRYDYGRPISSLIEKEGSIYNIALNLFSEFCTGKYENYLDNSQVEKFIGWLEQNSGHLQKNIENIIKNKLIEGDLKTEEQVYYALGFMVGGQYVLGKYTDYDEEVDGRRVNLYCSGSDAMWLDATTISIGIPSYGKNPKKNSVFIGFLRGLNAGIHEYAHGLRKFNYGMQEGHVNELGVSLVSLDLLLPIYYKDIGKVSAGMRDAIRLAEQIKSGRIDFRYADIVEGEYLDFAVAPWIKAYFEKDGGEVPKEFIMNNAYKTMGVAEMLKVLYRKDTVFRKDEYLANFDKEKYLGNIQPGRVRDVLSGVFDNLLKEHWKTPQEFFEKLFDALDTGFGCRPSPMEAPDGFVYLMPKERERNAFRG